MAFECAVPADHPCLPGHFPGRPIVPGVLLIDHVLAELEKVQERRVVRLRRVKFMAPLLPQEMAQVHCDLDGVRVSFEISTRRDGVVVILARGSLLLQADGEPG